MASKIQVKRGNKADLPILSDGEYGFCQDTSEIFIGNGGTNTKIYPTTSLDASSVTVEDIESMFESVNVEGVLSELGESILDILNGVSTVGKASDANTVGGFTVAKNVPSNAKFTDTIYTHPSTHSIAEVSGLQSALDGKVDDSQVLTNVPTGAKFTDTVTTINDKTGVITKDDIVALGIPSSDTNTTYSEITTAEIDTGTASTLRTITARRLKYLLDKIVALFPTKVSELTNDSGFLSELPTSLPANGGNADTVGGFTVGVDVPANAKFTDTDTVYTHPTTAGNKHIPTGGTVGQILKNTNSGTATWQDENETTIANNLIETITGKALDATQGKALKDSVDEHKAETMQLKFSELSSTATNVDNEGIYVNTEWKRKDGTTYAKSTLTGTSPNYNRIKVDYYNETGTTVIKTITWDLTYDDNDFIYNKAVI